MPSLRLSWTDNKVRRWSLNTKHTEKISKGGLPSRGTSRNITILGSTSRASMDMTATPNQFSLRESTSLEISRWLLTPITLLAWSANSQLRSLQSLRPPCHYGAGGALKGWCTQTADHDPRPLKQHPLQARAITLHLHQPSREGIANAYSFVITPCADVSSPKLSKRVLVPMISGIPTPRMIFPTSRMSRVCRARTATTMMSSTTCLRSAFFSRRFYVGDRH